MKAKLVKEASFIIPFLPSDSVLGFLIAPMTVTWFVLLKMQYISIYHIDNCVPCKK